MGSCIQYYQNVLASGHVVVHVPYDMGWLGADLAAGRVSRSRRFEAEKDTWIISRAHVTARMSWNQVDAIGKQISSLHGWASLVLDWRPLIFYCDGARDM